MKRKAFPQAAAEVTVFPLPISAEVVMKLMSNHCSLLLDSSKADLLCHKMSGCRQCL